MPMMQTMVSSLNTTFRVENLGEINPELFEKGVPLSDAARRLGLDDMGLAEWLDKIPAALHDGIRGAILSALTRDVPHPVTFAWAPSYDYELSMWDVSAGPRTPGGVTILLKTPYDH
jgi:hypothetical protein